MKNSFFNIIFVILLICILIGIVVHPKLVLDSAHDSLLTWFNVVIPSLLPFFIISEILIGVGFVDFIGKLLQPIMKQVFRVPGVSAFPFAMSIISGYPTGIKIVSNLRSKKLISKLDAERTMSFSSTSGPLFMIGTVSIGMLNNPALVPLILYPHYLGVLTIGFFYRFHNNNNNKLYHLSIPENQEPVLNRNNENTIPIGKIISNSVKNSINTITLIGGFMIIYTVLVEIIFVSNFFNLLIDFIQKIIPITLDKELVKAFFAGIFEMTTGCKKISAANLKLIHKVTLINFLIGWSGFSVHSQALSFISNTDINGKLYIFIKLIHGSLSAVYTILLYNFIYKDLISPSFYPYYYPMDPIFILEWPNLLLNSIKLALLMTLYLLISSLIVFFIQCFVSSE
ncbi:MAG: sporulation integral membrane protein YlbJ [Tissierellia bacterium]|nr:sporulation integral membrane protein YlbJ [Tissierellia bacterium]